MTANRPRTTLITGASAGIGKEFAYQYAARGWDIVLTARRKERLEAIADDLEKKFSITAHIVPLDLAQTDSVDVLISKIEDWNLNIDGLVNNAGYGLSGTFFNTSWEDQAAFLQVLYNGPIELVHKLLPGMKNRNFGRVVNVASLAGYASGSAGHTLYGSVKAGLIKFSESINAEAASEALNIHCTALCPGFTWSEFHDVNGTREQTNTMPSWMWMDAEPVVRAGIEANESGKPVIVPGMPNKAIATLTRVLPEGVGRKVIQNQAKKYRRTQ